MPAGRRQLSAGRQLDTYELRGDRRDRDRGVQIRRAGGARVRAHGDAAALEQRRADREVREHAAKLKTIAGLAPPNLCADVRAWRASGYGELPATSVQFDAKFEPAWVAIGLDPEALHSYENPATKALAHRNEQIEEQLFDGEARVTETSYETIMDALELWP